MTLGDSYREARLRLESLRQALDCLLWAVVQGQPKRTSGHALADHFDAAAHDAMGLLAEALAAEGGGENERRPSAPGEARAVFILWQDHLSRLAAVLHDELGSYERMKALDDLGRRADAAWSGWARGVTDALNNCRLPLRDAERALFQCWRELTEHVGTGMRVALRSQERARPNPSSEVTRHADQTERQTR